MGFSWDITSNVVFTQCIPMSPNMWGWFMCGFTTSNMKYGSSMFEKVELYVYT